MTHTASLWPALPLSTLACLLLTSLLAGCGPVEREPGVAAEPVGQERTVASGSAGVRLRDEMGQTIYVPAYSHIFHRNASREVELAVTLSVRNTDPKHPVRVTGVEYYDDDGRLVQEYLDRPLVLGPLSSESFVVGERDRTGGVGANFLVAWWGRTGGSPPVAEAVMISTASSQGISFVSRGFAVRTSGDGLRREDRPVPTTPHSPLER